MTGRYILIIHLLLCVAIIHAGESMGGEVMIGTGNYSTLAMQRLTSDSMAVDPSFDFYKTKSWGEWGDEILKLGFTAVHIIIVADISLDEQNQMVQAFHERKMACVLRIYPTTDFDAYYQHPEWRQKMLDGSSQYDWRVYICPNSTAFTDHACSDVQKILQAVPYDAIELAEPWFEVWGGPYATNPNRGKYACVCDNCTRLFKEKTGVAPLDFLNNPDTLNTTNAEIYEKWQDFRVDSILQFCKRLFDTAKATRPGIRIIHMHLSDCTVEPGKSREYQAQDLDAALKFLKPDILIIEDAWQDWTQPNLQPDFVRTYAEAYVARSRAILPNLVMKAHADIGSLKTSQRNLTWMSQFGEEARAGGFNSVIFYEYSLGDYSN